MSMSRWMGLAHNALGRHKAVAHLARNVRNQANAVVSAHLNEIGYKQTNFGRDNEFRIIDLVAPTATSFIDVGGNKGVWSDRFIQKMPDPVGLVIEPGAACFEKLRTAYAPHKGVKVIAAAVSDYLGSAEFFETPENNELSSLHIQNTAGHGQYSKTTVPITTIDHEVDQLGWDKVSMVKIDAQGEDYYCLRGARKLLAEKRIDFVQFEYDASWQGVKLIAAAAFLRGFGYQLLQLHPNGLRKIDIDYFEDCGSANWLAFHDGSPDLGQSVVQ